jgi:hypothetical protein
MTAFLRVLFRLLFLWMFYTVIGTRRLFYLACAELRNYNRGNEWLVNHYLFHKTNA